jgi:hypothetical protein
LQFIIRFKFKDEGIGLCLRGKRLAWLPGGTKKIRKYKKGK